MSFKDAMDLVDDDLPDGAFFAMAHEIAGLEYGDGFCELLEEENPPQQASYRKPEFKCPNRLRKQIETFGTLFQHDAYHWTLRRDKQVIADWWPHKKQWRIKGKTEKGFYDADFVKALSSAFPAGGA
jgi:hypothetical protein